MRLLSQISQSGNPVHLVARDDQMFVLGPDTVRGAPTDKLVPGKLRRRGIMDGDIEHVHTALILAVIAPHVRSRPRGFHHDGDPMKLCVPWMENVTAHLLGSALDRSTTEFVECSSQVCSDILRGAAFDLMPVNEVDDFAVP